MFLAKLDIRKASDSVYQEAMARQVEIDVGEVANMPWEARAWVTLLRAGEMTIDFRGETFVLSQTNGVRQGSPDSPIAFGRKRPGGVHYCCSWGQAHYWQPSARRRGKLHG